MQRRKIRMKRKPSALGTLLLVFVLGFTACSSSSVSTSPPAGDAIADAAAAIAGPDEQRITTAARDATEIVGTIRIGAALSETGKFAVEGRDSRQGYDTWARWVNEEYGGIRLEDGRYEVEIIYYDDESDADTAANLTQRLINEDEVQFMLGPYSSGLTTGASAISEAADIIMVEGNGTSDVMFERGFQNLFLVATVASDYTLSGIEQLAAEGATSAVVAYEDTSFPTAVADGAVRHLEAAGIEVLAAESYPKDPIDLTPMISRFRELDPDVFVGGGHYFDAILFVNAADDVGFDPDAMLITVGPSNPELTNELGQSVDGVIGPTQWEATMSYEGPWMGSAADFARRYETYWGEPPVYQAASAAASGLALHIAIEEAGTTETAAVREALRNMNADTFYGPINFDERGVNTAKPMGTVQVQGSDINLIAPVATAVADFDYPISR